MPSAPDSPAAQIQQHPDNLAHNPQHQRNRSRGQDNPQSRGHNTGKNELGRRDRHGEKVSRIYPRELTKSPATASRYPPPTSPSLGPVHNATTSPFLSALGSTTNTAAYHTSEWAKSLPFFAHQPPTTNGVSISGSPPTYGSPNTMSSSPPAGGRPLSHPNHHSSLGGRLRYSPKQSPGRDRRGSMFSQRSPYAGQAPLPHQPQAHFYGAPDLDFGLLNAPNGGLVPGANGYYCGFDTLETAGDSASIQVENVVLTGYEGSLEIRRVERDKMDFIGNLEGLKGAVVGAKILPWTAQKDLHASLRPLVALVIHGPVLGDSKDEVAMSGSSSAITDDHDSLSHPPTRPSSSKAGGPLDAVTHYQTSVEVYSLKAHEYVATLYKSSPVALAHPINHPLFAPPPPVDGLKIDANGKYVVVASGCSGEVFVFAPYENHESAGSEKFRCVGKLWTSVQLREPVSASSNSSAAEINSPIKESVGQHGVPLFSLSHRWLAVVHPPSSSLFSSGGTALLSDVNRKPPGITTHMAPSQPPITCATVTSEEDSVFNRMAREGAQAVIKGAQWVSDQGVQAWKSYWGRSSGPTRTGSGLPTSPAPDVHAQQYFPPTHAHTTMAQQASNEPVPISIFDLQRLLDAEDSKNKNVLTPVATFAAPFGCSFLSFAPSGLSLLTVSKKGDVQFVWDLMRLSYGKSGPAADGTTSGAHVRQVAKFTRMTVANVVDVVWAAPKGDKLAILTERGTIHIHELPASAFQWPPLRRVQKPSETQKSISSDKPPERPASKGGLNGATVSSAFQAINGKIASVRARSSSSGSKLPTLSSLSIAPAAGARGGGKAVAAGLSKGFGAATGSVNTLRHAGDNKLHLHNLKHGVSPGCVRWLSGKERGSIAVVAGGTVRIHPIKQVLVTRGKSTTSRTTVSRAKSLEFALPNIPDSTLPPAVLSILEAKPGDEAYPVTAHGEWRLRSLAAATSPNALGSAGGNAHPLSFAEIETNPPYQPFHTDRRINLFAYATPDMSPLHQDDCAELDRPPEQPHHDPHHIADDSPWVFGEDIPATRLMISSSSNSGLDEAHGNDGEDGGAGFTREGKVERSVRLGEGDEVVEQVVVTTRRRRVKRGGDGANGVEADDGFFEDDCEVLDFAEDRV